MKFQYLAQFPVNYLYHPVLPSLLFLLHEIAAFARYVINHFISFSALPKLAFALRIIDFRFNIIGTDNDVNFTFSFLQSFPGSLPKTLGKGR